MSSLYRASFIKAPMISNGLSSYIAATMTFSSAKNCSKVRISLDSKNFRDEQTPALHLVPACLLLAF